MVRMMPNVIAAAGTVDFALLRLSAKRAPDRALPRRGRYSGVQFVSFRMYRE
jgi:hypothetical protein